ncbi:hypothetical protein GCM10027610_144530 [Dactylosporangium cerinum]
MRRGAGLPLVEVLTGEDQEWLEQVDVVQPVLWAVMVSLAAVWESFGVQVAGVVGHSQGEIAAAVVAGALSLADGALVVSARSRLLRDLAGTGGMLVVGAPVDELGELPDGVSVAAVNGPRLIVVSGDNAGLDTVAAACAERGVWAKRVPVDYASHSVHVEAIREPLLAALDGLTAQQCRLPFYSTVTGELIDGSTLDARYWFDNLRHPVRFDDVIASLVADGHTAFVEVSPHPVLTGGVGERANVVVGTLRRDEGGWDRMLRSAGELWAAGIEVDWTTTLGENTGTVDLPTYPFQRQRFWPSGAGEALLGTAVHLAEGDGTVFTGRLTLSTHPWLADHRVLDRVLLPGTAFVELALHAGAVRELTIEAPLVIPDTGGVTLQVRVGAPDETGDRPVRISSRSEDSWTHHATGLIAAEPTNAAFDLTAWPPPGAEPIDLDGFYERGAEAGYGYGPAFQGLRKAWRHGENVYADVALPDPATAAGFGLHPALLDAALHAASLGDFITPGEIRLPFAWTGINLHAIGAAAVRVRIASAGTDSVTVDIADNTGAPVASIDSLTLRPVSADRLGAPEDAALREALFTVEWAPQSHDMAAATGDARAVVLGDPDTAELLGLPHLTAPGDLAAPTTVVLPLLRRETGPDAAAVHAAARRALQAVQEWLADDRTAGSNLIVLTEGAVPAGGPVSDLAGAAVWGLLRSAQSENPDRLTLVDIDDTDASRRLVAGAGELGEPQIALRAGRAWRPRLTRALPPTELRPPAGSDAWRLDIVGDRTLEHLSLVPAPDATGPLLPGQVRVAIRAAGINFRDVLMALGMYPEPALMGSEGAGVVVEVAPDVTDLTPGDRVFGSLHGTFGPLAVTDRNLLSPMPAGWTFAEAASVSTAYLTAYYGLRDLAGLRAGDTLLVHAAAGGVGMAAVQLARHWGVEVYGTASPSKWDALRGLGLDDAHIASSRDLDFEATFRAATGGRGVDVVLNSLAGSYVDASLRLLAPGGRFVEMGKTDIRGAESARPDITYRAFDLTQAAWTRVRDIQTEIVTLFEQGALSLSPVTVWDVREAAAAFRHMSQAKHIGKNVFTVPAAPQGTVLITGGTGLLGGLFAEHLVRSYNVRDLVLTSRQGMDAPGATDLVDRLAELGAHAEVVACDAADRDALAAVIAGRALAGVVHCAGVLDDGVFASLTPDRLDAVLRPKVDAAVLLHELTKDMDLAWFVVFSSASATFGTAGQANYAAANAFLDGLMSHRRSLGLPGLSLAWGLWAEASTMTGHLEDRDKTRIGGTLTNDHGLALFDRAVDHANPHLVPIAVDLPALRTAGVPVPALLRGLVRPQVRRAAASTAAATPFADRYATLAADDRRQLLLDLVTTNAAAVLGHADRGAVDADRAFRDLGFDSLTSVELRNRLAAATGTRLPATLVFDYPTPAVLAAHLDERIAGAAASPAAPVRHRDAGVDDDAIAIVGMSCRLPGGVQSPRTCGSCSPPRRTPSHRSRATVAGHSTRSTTPTRIIRAPRMSGRAGSSPTPTASTRDSSGSPPRGRRHGPAAAAAPRGVVGGVRARRDRADLGTRQPDRRVRRRRVVELRHRRRPARRGRGAPAHRYRQQRDVRAAVIPVRPRRTRGHGRHRLLVVARRAAPRRPGDPAGRMLARPRRRRHRHHQPRHLHRVQPPAGTRRRRPLQAVRRGRRRHEHGGGRRHPRPRTRRRRPAQRPPHPRGRPWQRRQPGRRQQRPDRAERARAAAGHPAGPRQRPPRTIRCGRRRGARHRHRTRRPDRSAGAAGHVRPGPHRRPSTVARLGQVEHRPHPSSRRCRRDHQDGPRDAARRPAALAPRRRTDPHVDWSEGRIELLTGAAPWPETGRPRRFGVSSFGISGTNAHAIFEQPPADPVPVTPPATGDAVAWLLSARTGPALAAQAARLRAVITADPSVSPADVAVSLAAGRATLEHRAAVVAADTDAFRAGLAAIEAEHGGAGVVRGVVGTGRTAFLFTGQGAQRAGMGAGLCERFPVFAEVYDDIRGRFAALLDEPLRDADVNQTVYTQASLFALEVALFRLVESFGVKPDYLLGHSIGELAAAHVAGVLSLDDAIQLVAARGRLMQALPAGGAMLAVQATEAEVRTVLEPFAGRVDIAAVNGPTSIVVSGEASAIDGLFKDRKTSRLKVSHAFHSPLMEPMLEEFRAVAAGLTYAPPRIPIVSNLTGQPVQEYTADYWVRHVRDAVRFADGVAWLAGNGVTRFLEVGPSGVLTAMAQTCLPDSDRTFVAALRADRHEHETLLLALAALHVVGASVDWVSLLATDGGRTIDVPTYAFQRERYWLDPVRPGDRPATGEPDAIEASFWDAVDREDLERLTGVLRAEDPDVLGPVLPVLSSWRRQHREASVVDAWRHRAHWRALTELPAGRLTGTWLIVAPAGSDTGPIADALTRAGATAQLFAMPEVAADRYELAGALLEYTTGLSDLAGVLALTGLADDPHPDHCAVPIGVARTLTVLQALGDAGIDVPLWCVTRGAVSIGRADP